MATPVGLVELMLYTLRFSPMHGHIHSTQLAICMYNVLWVLGNGHRLHADKWLLIAY